MAPDPSAFLIVLNEPYSGHPNIAPGAHIEPRIGQTIRLISGMNQIGRIESPDVTIRIPDTSIRRRHALIWNEEGRWILENRETIGRATLNDRDQIRLGFYEFWFRLQLPERAWLTPPVRGLARCISANREFHLLPILADALEEAGCIDEVILKHCRSPRQVWRVSWVAEFLCEQQAEAGTGKRSGVGRESLPADSPR
jgi:hypothetical protein